MIHRYSMYFPLFHLIHSMLWEIFRILELFSTQPLPWLSGKPLVSLKNQARPQTTTFLLVFIQAVKQKCLRTFSDTLCTVSVSTCAIRSCIFFLAGSQVTKASGVLQMESASSLPEGDAVFCTIIGVPQFGDCIKLFFFFFCATFFLLVPQDILWYCCY